MRRALTVAFIFAGSLALAAVSALLISGARDARADVLNSDRTPYFRTWTAVAYGSVNCTNVAAAVPTTALASRSEIVLHNEGTAAIYVATDSSVTTANGVKLAVGEKLALPVGPGIAVNCIVASGTHAIRYIEGRF